MRIASSSTTADILRELGERLRAYRLQQNATVQRVAVNAGVGVATLQRAETGQGMTLANLVKVLRALGRLDDLNAFLPAPAVSPIALASLGHERRRARGT